MHRRRAGPSWSPHGLTAPVIVSLTSYPPRYATLALTLKCLLLQSAHANQVILWTDDQSGAGLPPDVLELRKWGLTIGWCDNTLRSHNKYIHSWRRHPAAFIATADDDTYYWPGWLAELIASYDPGGNVIPCHRVHRISLGPAGYPAPYRDWQWESPETRPGVLVFPTGAGGILYPPGCLHPDVDDEARILALCPRADDIWLYWMALRQGCLFCRTKKTHHLHHWRGSQEQALMWGNVFQGSGNDEQISAMIDAFGWPPNPSPSAYRPRERWSRDGWAS